MSVATKTTQRRKQRRKQPWDTSDYMRIVDARVEGDNLVVLFKDHTWAEIGVEKFLSRHTGTRWDRMTFSHFTVIVPTDEGAIEISWLSIRSLSDPAFAAHLEAIAKESTRLTGR